MTFDLRTLTLAPALLALGGWSTTAAAGALNPWYGRLDNGAAAVTPYVYVMEDGEVDPSVYVQGSFADHFDLLVGAGGAFSSTGDAAFNTVDVMPRIFLNDNLGGTVRVIIDPATGASSVGPEIHAVRSRGRFTLAINAGFADRTTYGLFAPELSLGQRASVFLEVNPAFGIDGGAELTTVPGMGFTLDREGNHSMALGVQIPTLAPAAPSYGLWYSTGFGA